MPVIWAISQEYYPGVLSERRCAALRHRSGSSHGLLVRVRFVTPNGVSAHGTEVTTRSQAVRGAVSLHEGAAGHRPHAPLSFWLSVPPSIRLSIPLVLSSGAPCSPPLIPVQLQIPADAEQYLRPSKASARSVTGPTQIGTGARGWASGRWADWEPGWAGVRYGQVCPGRAGTARLYHDIQVFPLPVLSLAVRTQPDHKHSN